MILAMMLMIAGVTGSVAVVLGYTIGTTRTRDALKLARYLDAIALADDLIKNPDGRDLRPRAQKIVAAHRAAYPDQEI